MSEHPELIALGTGLSKRFRSVSALADVSVRLERGSVTALLGSNGAGKTTLLRILAGISRPTAGELRSDGRDGVTVGWAPQTPAVYPRLTARENLHLFCALEGADDPASAAEELLARAGLTEVADRYTRELSTGTAQRLNIAVALAGRPDVLLLDEPTATLSEDHVRRIWRWLDELRADDGLAVLFSTQSVDEAARAASRMIVLRSGSVAFEGTVEELVARHGVPGVSSTDAAVAAFLQLVGDAE